MNLPEFALEQGEQRHATWSVPWSDLMMVMFILFLVLFVFSLREKERLVLSHRSTASIQSVTSSNAQLNMLPLYEVLRERLLGHERMLNVAFTEDASIVISLFGENFFNPMSYEIEHRPGLLLSKIGHAISVAQGTIVITGFADDAPPTPQGSRTSEQGAWEVAALRAAAVAEHFVHQAGINPEMLIIQARGTAHPLLPDFIETRNSQRRLEIRIDPDQPSSAR
ncbi:Flagellar motor protein MotB [Desulfonatronum thiosulfatophilum]|uniref:Flagellar motor protein MotB n=2 Tax=Desulfonatronum thiosulfatophilum TaxID=617002 RepID=A0A1G6EK38_9BACT|nr:Flagellar motor protein MotB [Desulfonatronum thiosulfatophilum]